VHHGEQSHNNLTEGLLKKSNLGAFATLLASTAYNRDIFAFTFAIIIIINGGKRLLPAHFYDFSMLQMWDISTKFPTIAMFVITNL
jgi:hypothetical protein